MSNYGIFLIVALFGVTAAQFEIEPPEMTLLDGGGLRMAIPRKYSLVFKEVTPAVTHFHCKV